MTDIVDRLRNHQLWDMEEVDAMTREAAAEIERLTRKEQALLDLIQRRVAEIERLRAALKGIDEWSINHEDARERARRALGPKP